MAALNDLRMQLKAALDNMWARIDARIHAIEEGGGGGGQDNVIEAISFNGINRPPDANKRVSMSESDPTVPSWAKASQKPSYTATEVGAMPAEPPSIELKPPAGSGAGGGYLDFHFNGSSADYTTRLIEDAPGQLTLLGSLILSSPLGVPSGGTGATDAAGARANLHAMQNPDTSAPRYDTGNLNSAPVGFSAWYSPNCVNAPFQTWASVLTMNFIVGYAQQIAFSWAGNQIAYRVCDNGTWYAWKYIAMS